MSGKLQKAKDFLNKKMGRVKEKKSAINIEDSYDVKTTVLPEHFNDPQYKPLTDELKDVKIKMQKLSQLLLMDTYMFIDGTEDGDKNEFKIVFPEKDKGGKEINITDPQKKEIVLDKLQEYSDKFFNELKDHDYNLWLREKNLEYFDDDGKIPPILIFKKSKDSVESGSLGRNYHDTDDISMDPQIKKTKEIKGKNIFKNEFSNRGKELGFYGAIPALAAAFSPVSPIAAAATAAASALAGGLDIGKKKKKDIFDLQKDIDEVFEKVDPFMKDFKLHHVEVSDGGREELLKNIYETKDTHEGSKEIFNFAPFTRELKTYEEYKAIKEKLSEMRKEKNEAKKKADGAPEDTSLNDTYQELKNNYKEEKKKAPVEVISKSDISIQYFNFNVKNFCSQIEVNNDNTDKSIVDADN